MEGYKIGDRVSLDKCALSLSFIVGRRTYTDMYEGKTGTVIGFTADGTKLAIQFDTIVFTNYKDQRSSHDNGCHGKGKLHYCWYIPPIGVNKLDDELLLLL